MQSIIISVSSINAYTILLFYARAVKCQESVMLHTFLLRPVVLHTWVDVIISSAIKTSPADSIGDIYESLFIEKYQTCNSCIVTGKEERILVTIQRH